MGFRFLLSKDKFLGGECNVSSLECIYIKSRLLVLCNPGRNKEEIVKLTTNRMNLLF